MIIDGVVDPEKWFYRNGLPDASQVGVDVDGQDNCLPTHSYLMRHSIYQQYNLHPCGK